MGPIDFGVACDRLGSYAGMLIVAALLCLSSAIMALLIGRYLYLASAV